MLPPPSNTAFSGLETERSLTAVRGAGNFSGKAGVPTAANAPASPLISKPRTAAAFTLVEMIVVMTVIVLLVTVTVPVFKNLLGGRGVESSINNVTGILELGRATAIANRTYVYVLFKNVVTTDNNSELRCAAVMSQNNLNTIKDLTNLKPITKLVKTINVKSVKFEQLPASVQKITPPELAPSQTDDPFIDASVSGSAGTDFPKVVIANEDFTGVSYICFNPQGEITTSGDSYNLLVETRKCLGLIPTRGPNPQPNTSDGAVVATYGGNGTIRIVRP